MRPTSTSGLSQSSWVALCRRYRFGCAATGAFVWTWKRRMSAPVKKRGFQGESAPRVGSSLLFQQMVDRVHSRRLGPVLDRDHGAPGDVPGIQDDLRFTIDALHVRP